jgi:predicted kinase
MLGPYWIPSRERLVNKIRVFTIEEAMNNKYDVVVDNMNLSEKATREIIDIANKNNYDIEYRDFKTLLKTCIDRDSKRENPIGAQVIHDTYNRHKDFYLKSFIY